MRMLLLTLLLVAGSQASLLKALVAKVRSSAGAPGTAAKRQLDPNVQTPEDPNGVIFNHADELKQYMQAALNASHRLDHPEKYQQPLKDFLDLIDHVVASHQTSPTSSTSLKKRQLDPNVQVPEDPNGMIFNHADELKQYMQAALNASHRLDHPEKYQQPLKDFLDLIDHVVASHQTNPTSSTSFKKRQLDPNVQTPEDPNGVIFNHADELKQYMQAALNASHRLDHPEKYQQPLKDFLDLIDHVVASHQTPPTSSTDFKKRQLDPNVQTPEDPNGVIFNHADELKQYMQAALNASHRLDHPEKYQQPLKDFLDLIDHVVASHQTPPTSSTDFKKRQLDPNVQTPEDPNGMIFNHADELKQYMQAALNASHRLDHPEKYQQPLKDFLDLIDHVVASHQTPPTSSTSFKKRELGANQD